MRSDTKIAAAVTIAALVAIVTIYVVNGLPRNEDPVPVSEHPVVAGTIIPAPVSRQDAAGTFSMTGASVSGPLSEYAAEVLKHADGQAWIILDSRIDEACSVFQDYLDTRESGAVKWADTPRELAETVGIDADGLEQTVQQTQRFARGEQDDELGRTFWEQELTGRLAAVSVRPALFHTQGGLRVDEHARVVDDHEAPITGLYASGGAAMGISGHGAGGYLAGNGLLPALGLAYLAANHVAEVTSRWT